MCFSASASFIAGTSLSVIGVAALRKVETRTEIPFAAIPLLFGIQQLIEGVIWLTFSTNTPLLKQIMPYLYTGFSHVLWPMYVPLSIGLLEAVRWRRRLIFACAAAGTLVGIYLLYFLATRMVVAQIVGRSIVYVAPHLYEIPVMMIYLVVTCGSCVVSSHGVVRLFGLLAFSAYLVTYVVAAFALVSVWCFFAAILSLQLYLHFRSRNSAGLPGTLRSGLPSHPQP